MERRGKAENDALENGVTTYEVALQNMGAPCFIFPKIYTILYLIDYVTNIIANAVIS